MVILAMALFLVLGAREASSAETAGASIGETIGGTVVAIGESLPMAAGVALSPAIIAGVIIMLMTARGAVNTLALLAGWVVGIIAVGILVFMMPGLETSRGDPTVAAGWLRIVLGLLLLVLGFRKWRRRPKGVEPVATPKLLLGLDRFTPAKSAVIGFLSTAVSPKNLFLNAAAAASIDESSLNPTAQIAAFVVYTILASLSIANMEPQLERWRDWLITNNAALLAMLFLIFGTLLIGQGMEIVARQSGT